MVPAYKPLKPVVMYGYDKLSNDEIHTQQSTEEYMIELWARLHTQHIFQARKYNSEGSSMAYTPY